MSIALLVITDGRSEYLARCIESARRNVYGPIVQRLMFDDTGNAGYRAKLAALYPEFKHINAGPRVGYGGAVAAAWRYLAAHSAAEWVAHLEGDFTFTRPVLLPDMAAVLEDHPHLAQMALRRQAWNDTERAAGGIVEQNPDAYIDCGDRAGRLWLEHRRCFTTNPCLYRRSLCTLGWPDVPRSEGEFTHFLLREGLPGVAGVDVAFGYWGGRSSPVWVEHIGDVRAGVGY